MSISEITRQHRFDRAVEQGPECWEWRGWRTASGYGMFRWDTGTRITAHRAAYRLWIGPIPDAAEIDHLCRNRGCVNPMHLEAVALGENRRRRRHASGDALPNGRKDTCPRGHAYDTRHGHARACKTCAREATRRWRDRQRSE